MSPEVEIALIKILKETTDIKTAKALIELLLGDK